MTDDQSREPRGTRSDDKAGDGESDAPSGRRRLRFSERVVDLDSWPEREERFPGEMVDMKALGSETAVFKARVQRGGRISIPDAERESLGIRHGQIVQALVFPLEQHDEDTEDAPEGERTHDAEDESDE